MAKTLLLGVDGERYKERRGRGEEADDVKLEGGGREKETM